MEQQQALNTPSNPVFESYSDAEFIALLTDGIADTVLNSKQQHEEEV
jgi:hypothetical protein